MVMEHVSKMDKNGVVLVFTFVPLPVMSTGIRRGALTRAKKNRKYICDMSKSSKQKVKQVVTS